MNIEGLTTEIQKLEYQIKKLTYTVDHQKYPVEKLILEMDWSEKQFNEVNNIFEKYDNKLREGKEVEWTKFETAFKELFNICPETVKSIVEAFYRDGLWTNVCEKYCRAKSAPDSL